ncbi:FtsX-like permease family protein [uncultured Blautia sp.]|uniref:ABC transporter permease n=1 Tax=uncultured Blautia sp. TaxID=765821 RepID=UPI00280B5AD3|nr:FtsX-like permease family protein [uncultured Blautia sp.]
MRSYLSLIPISAKVRKRQNRMTILCIIISVLLVTTVFSTADMFIRTKSSELQEKHGNWHIRLENISQSMGQEISQRSDTAGVGWVEEFNSDADQPYYIGEKKAALYGTDNIYLSQLSNALEEGVLPQNDREIMLSSNAKTALDVSLGDRITLQTPAGDTEFIISGFGSDNKDDYRGQTYLVAVYMTRSEFGALMEENKTETDPVCYVQFQDASKASGAIKELKQQYHLSGESISENTAVMGLTGQSSSESVKNIYGLAIILFILVLMAGILMISGSMNSNVAQRIKFFGMLRCIGASRKQIIRYVRFEALNWCKTAVPVGLFAGIMISWGICIMLRYGIGGEFSSMPVFAVSPIGLLSGAAVGVVAVLLAAQSPARRAARVSPVAAVSGNVDSTSFAGHTVNLGLGKVEKVLGIHHAFTPKKNWILMTFSFSLSVILFFSFSVGLDFAQALLPSLRSWQPDITLTGYANEQILSPALEDSILSVPGVEHVFGSAYMEKVSAASSSQGIDYVNLISYSEYLLDSAQECLVQGDLSEIHGNSDQVMTVLNKDNPLKVGDIIEIAGQKLKITCAVSDGIYPSEYSVICSQETFARLTGKENYSLIGVQLQENASDESIKKIENLAGRDVIFEDMRERNKQDHATYAASVFIVYSFLAILAMITLFHIINSISMSVTARKKQYGAMRAVGMDRKQLTRMIAAEAFTYTASGLIVGCSTGIPLSWFLHTRLLTRYFGTPWTLPITLIGITVVFGIVSAAAAVYVPAKRICSMEITEAVNEW